MSLIHRALIEYDRLSKVDRENTAGWNAWYTSNLCAPVITAFYLIFVVHLGPKMMKNRRPFSLRYLVMGYNIVQVAYNAYLFVQVTNTGWMLLTNRLMDMLDTVFHVLRKKYSYISFLHVFHHANAFFFGWYLARYYPGGGIAVFLGWNCFVHIFMYTYYFASAQANLRPYVTHYKKQVTQLQLIQFITLLPYAIYVVTDPNCNAYPRWLMWLALFEDIVFLYLFGRFYVRAYCSNKKKD